jgi:hypothetical protein
MTAHVRVGGVWRQLAPKVKVGAAWHSLSGGFVRVGGVWRRFYGTIDTQTMVTGQQTGPGLFNGFWRTLFGTLTDGTSNVVGPGAVIEQLLWADTGYVYFVVAGAFPNSGWTQFTSNGRIYKRLDATFTQPTGPSQTAWTWAGQATSPFLGNPVVKWE